MREQQGIHPAVRWAGWIPLFLGLLIPLGNSLLAMVVFRDPSCERVQWSFAPLLAACEPVGGVLTAYGWFGTVLVLVLLGTAFGVAGVGVARIRGLRGTQRADAIHFGVTVLIVLAIAGASIVRQLDPTQPLNAWVFFASGAGMVVYIVSSLILALRLAATHRL